MDEESLTRALSTKVFGRPLIFFESIDSTNSEAKRRIDLGGAPPGTVLIAASQSAGRGTGSNTWISDRPEGLWFSLVLEAPLRFDPISLLPAIALADMLRQKYDVPAHVKWPNDVLVGTRKISGTLIEEHRRTSGPPSYIIGIGLNVNQTSFPESIAHKAVSLAQASGGQALPLERVFADLLASLERWYHSSVDPIEAWLQLTRMVGRVLTIREPNGERLALCEGLTRPTGYLQVRNENGALDELSSATTTDIDTSYAAEDVSAWCSLARASASASAQHARLVPKPAAEYHTRADLEDFERKKLEIPYLQELFVGRDMVFREEVLHILYAAPSIRQLVSIGAGYDEWYAHELGDRLTVFEVDSRTKLVKKKALAGARYAARLLVGDASHPAALVQRLRSSGYAAESPALVVMQGLLYYLPDQTLDPLFATLSSTLAPHSHIILDFQIGDPPTDAILGGMQTSGMRTDFHPASTWVRRFEDLGFETVKLLNLGHADPLMSFGEWRERIRSTVIVLRRKR